MMGEGVVKRCALRDGYSTLVGWGIGSGLVGPANDGTVSKERRSVNCGTSTKSALAWSLLNRVNR